MKRTSRRQTPMARLARKSGGHEAKLAYCGNVLIENRNGLVVDTELLQCNGTAERDAAMLMAERLEGDGRVTLGTDKGYDTKEFVKEMRQMKVTPHVAQNDGRRGGSAIDERTTRHAGYKVSQQKRKKIEEVVRLAENRGIAAQDAAPRGTKSRKGIYLRGRRLQLGADSEPAVSGSSGDISQGTSVPELLKIGGSATN
jgi:hypothetical protein